MKNTFSFIKSFGLIWVFVLPLLISIPIFAQEETKPDLTRKEKKEQKRAAKIKEQMASFDWMIQMVRDTSFVFEGDLIVTSRGKTERLNQQTNFFSLEGNHANFQLAFNDLSSMNGRNRTAQLIEYHVSAKDFTKAIIVSGTLEPNAFAGNVQFSITIQSNGRSILTLTPAYGKSFKIEGKTLAAEESNIYRTSPDFKP
jgi:hypothetical protein